MNRMMKYLTLILVFGISLIVAYPQQDWTVGRQRLQYEFQQQQQQQQQQQRQQQQQTNNPGLSTTTPSPSSSATVATTPSPQYLACLQSCPTTSEYNPICGSDDINYHNNGRLNCAIRCGQNVVARRLGTCQGL